MNIVAAVVIVGGLAWMAGWLVWVMWNNRKVATMDEASRSEPRERTHHHLAKAVRFSPVEIHNAMKDVSGFNAKLAVLITKTVGSMACAYVFCLIALLSLPAILIQAGVLTVSSVPTILTKPGLILIVAWIAQTFIQLVLLSIIMVGQDVQSIASDARAEKQFKDTEEIADWLNLETEGGLRLAIEATNDVKAHLELAPTPLPKLNGALVSAS